MMSEQSRDLEMFKKFCNKTIFDKKKCLNNGPKLENELGIRFIILLIYYFNTIGQIACGRYCKLDVFCLN